MVLIAAGGVVCLDGKVCLLRRSKSDFDEMWTNPGGKPKGKETLEETAIREVREELDVEVRILRKLAEYEDIRDGQLFGKYTGYLVGIVSGKPVLKEPDHFSEIGFFSLNELPECITPYTRRYIEKMKQLGL